MLDDLLILTTLLIGRQAAAPACHELDRLIAPAAGATVADARPVITWAPLPGASRYRVEIESRIPEGRVLVALDTQVGETRFQPPQPLTDHRAAVKVRVSAGCAPDDGARLRARAAAFQIDTSPLCATPAAMTVTPDRRALAWPAVPNATRYDVTLLRPGDGSVVRRGDTRQPAFALPSGPEPLVAVVRPYCPTGFGTAGSAFVPVAVP
jgi:hypothetical protein